MPETPELSGEPQVPISVRLDVRGPEKQLSQNKHSFMEIIKIQEKLFLERAKDMAMDK